MILSPTFSTDIQTNKINRDEKEETYEQPAPPADQEEAVVPAKSGGSVSKVKDMFNKPASPVQSASPPLARAPSKKAFAPTTAPAGQNSSRDPSKRSVNQQQFLGIKRKEQVPTLTRPEKVKVKFTYQQVSYI